MQCYSFRNQDLRAAEHIVVLDRRVFLVFVERLAPSSSASSRESRHPDDAIEVVYQYTPSVVSPNHAITGLKFFFTVTLDRPEPMVRMQPVRVPRILPVVPSPDEVRRLIEAAGNLKHRTALSVAYGARLRASEVVALRGADVDSERMTLRIEPGKGRRDRYAMLSPVLLERLRMWWLGSVRRARCPMAGG